MSETETQRSDDLLAEQGHDPYAAAAEREIAERVEEQEVAAVKAGDDGQADTIPDDEEPS